MKCKYNQGYGKEVTIEVVAFLPLFHFKEEYINLVDEKGESYPATWITYEQGELVAGCYENF